MSERQQDKKLAIAPSLTEIEELFSVQVTRDWRSTAIRQAVKEFASTLHSLLNVARTEEATLSERELMKLIPALLTESIRQKYRDLIAEALGRLAVGSQVDLLPLLAAAVDELRLVNRRPMNGGNDELHLRD
jgi:hypothetical protein